VIVTTADELTPALGAKRSCALVGRARATHYRHQRGPVHGPVALRPTPPNALDADERAEVLEVLHDARFVDLAPAQVWARLLDEDARYLCSISTMYRILGRHGEVRERRRQAKHPKNTVPELIATKPCDVWSWDITKLRGPVKGIHYYLFVIIDIYSRYVPGWMIAESSSGELAKVFIAETLARHDIARDALTLHADRGTEMTSKPVAELLADLGVTRSHGRPRVPNDNPFSESQFKTLKYCPEFPARFGSPQDARTFCAWFFDTYNHEHRHRALGLHTPASVHYGTAAEIRENRARVLADAYAAHPQRFASSPQPPKLPVIVWINPPTTDNTHEEGAAAQIA
jgi:putative transposase